MGQSCRRPLVIWDSPFHFCGLKEEQKDLLPIVGRYRSTSLMARCCMKLMRLAKKSGMNLY
jgi:hypothetical protein